MAWVPLAAAGIQAGGSLLGGMLGQAGQSAANAQQWQQNLTMFDMQQRSIPAAQLQAQDWQQMMRGTAYQESMRDMKAAGLNPILAAGSGATATPGGGIGSTSGSGGQVGNAGAAMGAGVTSAAGAARTYAETKAVLQNADTASAQEDLNKASTKLADKQSTKTDQDTATSKSAERLNDAAALTKVADAAASFANANSANATARVNTRVAEDTERFGDSPISKAVGGLLRMLNTGVRSVPNSATALEKVGITPPSTPAPPVYRRGPDGRPITDFWGRPK